MVLNEWLCSMLLVLMTNGGGVEENLYLKEYINIEHSIYSTRGSKYTRISYWMFDLRNCSETLNVKWAFQLGSIVLEVIEWHYETFYVRPLLLVDVIVCVSIVSSLDGGTTTLNSDAKQKQRHRHHRQFRSINLSCCHYLELSYTRSDAEQKTNSKAHEQTKI